VHRLVCVKALSLCPQALDHGVTLTTHMQDLLPPLEDAESPDGNSDVVAGVDQSYDAVTVDKERVRDALDALLSSAIRHTRAGGRVVLTAVKDPAHDCVGLRVENFPSRITKVKIFFPHFFASRWKTLGVWCPRDG